MNEYDNEVERLAQLMHNAVIAHVGAVEKRTDAMAGWDDLKEVSKERYRAVARAVIADRNK